MRTMSLSYIFAPLICLLAVSCSEHTPTYSLLPDRQQFEERDGKGGGLTTNQIDILFVINDQPSMSSFQDELVRSMASFMEVFETKGFEFKISVVTSYAYTADPTLAGYDSNNESRADFNDYNGVVHSGEFVLFPTSPDIYSAFAINAKPDKNSGGQDGRTLSSMRQALNSTRPVNAGFLREKSFLAVIIVDNQEDFSGNGRCDGCNVSGRYNAPTLDPVSIYVDFLDGITGTGGTMRRYNVSAMTQSAVPCQGGSNMVRIMDIVTRTNGVLGDICQADFGPTMAQMGDHIATLSTQYYLNRIPVVSSIRVFIDNVSISQDSVNGWTYDSGLNSIQFHGDSIPATGAIITVNFDPVSII